MSDDNQAMDSGARVSFFQLFSNMGYKVEVPIIQRDYAQGRTSEKSVRKAFLAALYTYLEEAKPGRDLDFVYGSLVEDGDSRKFIPLDGQQRLTTLFLLHWYLAQLSGNTESFREALSRDGKSLFSYETRASSSEFCDALMASSVDPAKLRVAGTGQELSAEIRDAGWFYLSWNHDPTIQSMLTMLDTIHGKFNAHPEFYERLVDRDQPVITFLFLNFDQFGLTDDLYIKMNARGKPLTDFENFKARFEQEVNRLGNSAPTRKLSFSQSLVNDYDYFIHKIDTDWADIFWAYRNTASEDDTYDVELMAFIRLVMAHYRLLEAAPGNAVGIDEFFVSGGKLKSLSFQECKDLGCFTEGFIGHLIKLMDILYSNGLQDGQISKYLKTPEYYSEHEVFRNVLASSTSYPEKLRFYAFYIYLLKAEDRQGLESWLRVVYNLIENTIINNLDEYYRMLVSLGRLSDKCESILTALSKGCKVPAFEASQVLEERIKAALILKSDKWAGLILELEKHPFFNGQIGFALNFSGILDFYSEKGHCEWGDEADQEYLAEFKRYAEAGSAVFSAIKDNSTSIDFLWERAVLSKGDYFTASTADRFNMLSTRATKNNIERDHSWKRLLRISQDSVWEARQELVKQVFDDPVFNAKDVKSSLQSICDTAAEDPSIEEWRLLFIQYPDLFKESNQGFIARDSSRVYLFKESQRNHHHSELHTLVLNWKMRGGNYKPFPFSEYCYVKGKDEEPYIKLSYWKFHEVSYRVKIEYYPREYKVEVYSESSKAYPDELVKAFEACEMEEKSSYFYTSYVHSCCSLEVTITYLEQLCARLQDLSDE